MNIKLLMRLLLEGRKSFEDITVIVFTPCHHVVAGVVIDMGLLLCFQSFITVKNNKGIILT